MGDGRAISIDDPVSAIIDTGELEALMLQGLDAPPEADDERPAEDLAQLVVRAYTLGQGALIARHRQRWLDALDARQRADGTWPYDPRWRRAIRVVGQVSAAYFLLGARPRHRIALIDELQDPAALRQWLERRNWDHPWGGAGHDVIGLIQSMANLGVGSAGTACRVMDFVQALAEPDTGHLAAGRFEVAGDQQFGAAFAFGIIYAFMRRPLPWAEPLLDFVLVRQYASGSWAPTFPGGSFNMDAAWLLSRYTRLMPHRREQAEQALRRLARYLAQELEQRQGEARQRAATQMFKTIVLLAEVFPHPQHRHRIWRFATDLTLHP